MNVTRRLTEDEADLAIANRESISGNVAISVNMLLMNECMKSMSTIDWFMDTLIRALVPDDYSIEIVDYSVIGGYGDTILFNVTGERIVNLKS